MTTQSSQDPRSLRLSKNVSLTAVAKFLGITPAYLSMLESDNRPWPPELLQRYNAVLTNPLTEPVNKPLLTPNPPLVNTPTVNKPPPVNKPVNTQEPEPDDIPPPLRRPQKPRTLHLPNRLR